MDDLDFNKTIPLYTDKAFSPRRFPHEEEVHYNRPTRYSNDPANEDYNVRVRGPMIYGMNITILDEQIR